MNKEILMIRMYVGDFVSNEFGNIGHEIINLYQADNGEHYIYVPDKGTIGKNKDIPESILFVRNCGGNVLEIIGKAVNIEKIDGCTVNKMSDDKCREINRNQRTYIRKNSITYGGIELPEFFNGNIAKRKSGQEIKLIPTNDIAIFFTYKAKNIYKSVNPIYITDDENKKSEYIHFVGNAEKKGINFPRSNQIRYITSEKAEFAYNKLNELTKNITDKSKWQEVPKLVSDGSKPEKEKNFIKIIGKDYDELVYSNMLGHFFLADKKTFVLFVEKVLLKNKNEHISIESDYNYSVEREYSVKHGSIDLLITVTDNKNRVFVIENKIKSGINGKRHDMSTDKDITQLDTYYNAINNDKNFKDYVKKFIIFTPEYNKAVEKYNKNNKKWEIITYKEIWEFYKNNPINNSYYEEFLYALERHSCEIDDNLEKDMKKRLLARVYELNKEQEQNK